MESNLFLLVSVAAQCYGVPAEQVISVERWHCSTAGLGKERCGHATQMEPEGIRHCVLGELLGIASGPCGLEARSLLVQLDGNIVGCVVDEVRAVQKLDTVLPVPELLREVAGKGVIGVSILDNQPVILLDLIRAMSAAMKGSGNR
ncbi:MAG: chemotaxis protein CheW [Alicyclobacillus sp.]|nr:chemotaxis protein CheW [Alicyclobacillus sp.]